jgi:hypothetical protein
MGRAHNRTGWLRRKNCSYRICKWYLYWPWIIFSDWDAIDATSATDTLDGIDNSFSIYHRDSIDRADFFQIPGIKKPLAIIIWMMPKLRRATIRMI